jgi:hypothetical protein
MGDSGSPYAWRTWTFLWNATPGEHVLFVRAIDGDGKMQPISQEWNFGGYGNNGVQRVNVIVR